MNSKLDLWNVMLSSYCRYWNSERVVYFLAIQNNWTKCHAVRGGEERITFLPHIDRNIRKPKESWTRILLKCDFETGRWNVILPSNRWSAKPPVEFQTNVIVVVKSLGYIQPCDLSNRLQRLCHPIPIQKCLPVNFVRIKNSQKTNESAKNVYRSREPYAFGINLK